MKILAAIANHGTSNRKYLDTLLSEYRSMSFDVHVAILSNIEKNLGSNVEVVVGLPSEDPWSLPFAYKKLFAERAEDYDLFIYSEDDTLITEKNITAFLDVTPSLAESEIAGFLRYEKDSNGAMFISSANNRFHWDPESVRQRGDLVFAHFSNHHSASFILTRDHLRRAIESGGFLVEPHSEHYDLLVTAATDPYTQCGFEKLICLSRIDDFLLPHLPNKYIGKMGLEYSQFLRQLEALHAIDRGELPKDRLFETATKVRHRLWSKSYYEPAREDMLGLVPKTIRSALSLGCGWGATEQKLQQRGVKVTAVPLDSVIAPCAELRGIELIHGTFQNALKQLSGRKFDCLFLSDVMHLVEHPDRLLSTYVQLLAPGGIVVAGIPNFNKTRFHLKRLLRKTEDTRPSDYEGTGVHAATTEDVKRWLESAGMRIEKIVYTVPERFRPAVHLLPGIANKIFGTDMIFVGKSNK
ncbi:class I SAM-dependent methyltransferase [Thermodesulfobacteriota bacterium]